MFQNLPATLQHAIWVNPALSETLAQSRAMQLSKAAMVGFAIPPTVITNNPSDVREFRATRRQRIVFKTLGTRATDTPDYGEAIEEAFGNDLTGRLERRETLEKSTVLFTQVLTARREANLDSIRIAPVIFQELVPKSAELRVTVVGDRIFACRMYSQEKSATRVDFRRFVLTGDHFRHERAELPVELEERIRRLMKELGLVFGCIDIIETKRRGYVFLEVNPSGQWQWTQELAGLPIDQALADLLIRECTGGFEARSVM